MKYVSLYAILLCSVSLLYAEPIKPLPQQVLYDSGKAELGKKLFFDPILSRDNTVSCATCHHLQRGGDDDLPVSVGIEGRVGNINAPTVYNSRFNFRQFWDGRAKNLKEQVFGPIQDPREMDERVENIIKKLRANPKYRTWFAKLYHEGLTRNTIEDAIAEFEKALVTPNAPFDQYLRGDKEAISSEAKRGYRLFKSKGCILCHNGINIGGNFYNKFGIYESIESSVLGWYTRTKREEDRMVFKVPSLRNVALTAPYMHDGRAKTLSEAVMIMSRHQLGRSFTAEEIRSVIAFLKTLNGQIPKIAGSE